MTSTTEAQRQTFRYLRSAHECAPAIRVTHTRFVGYVYRNPHYFGFDYQLSTDRPPDKMAEFWQKKNAKKFAYIKKKQYLCSVIQKQIIMTRENCKKFLEKRGYKVALQMGNYPYLSYYIAIPQLSYLQTLRGSLNGMVNEYKLRYN